MAQIAFVVEPRYRQPVLESTYFSAEKLYIPSFMDLIASALLRRGHSVDIYNNAGAEIVLRGMRCKPIDSDSKLNSADLAVFHNGAEELHKFNFGRAAIWQHNPTSFSKALKRKEFGSLFRYRPDLICLSQDAVAKTPKWMPYRRKILIPHAIQDSYFQVANSSLDNRQMKAYFASRPSRNLDFLIRAWERFVYPNLPQAELVICCPPSNKTFPFEQKKLLLSNIHYVGTLKQSELIELGSTARMLCYPGHSNETGCRVALDAIGMGLPIVTCGIGSLKDLVVHKQTGFIETAEKAYAERVVECMTDDALWQRLSLATFQHPWRKSYDENVLLWESAFGLSSDTSAMLCLR